MRAQILLVLGFIMIGLGGYVAVRPLWMHGTTLTPTRWLDMTFAIVFLLRGSLNVRRALQTLRSATAGSADQRG